MDAEQATAPRSPTTFADLEDELKENIFSYITSISERQILRRVCKSWYEVINAAFGIKLIVNNLNHDLLSSCACVTELDLVSLTLPIDMSKVQFRHRLHTLTFYNMIVTYNLFPLLYSMTSLVEVNFHDVILDLPEELIVIPKGVEDEHGAATAMVSSVQQLYFQSWNFAPSLLNLLSVFSKLEFNKLRTIEVVTTFTPQIPFEKVFIPTEHTPLDALHPFVRLIVKNLSTIQMVSYGPKLNQTRFKFLAVGTHEATPGQIKQLEELIVGSIFRHEFAAILLSQARLRVLDLGSCKFDTWGNVRTCISTNASTLEKICLKSFTFGQVWDCDVFTNIKSLDYLALHMTASPKTNLHFLPVSLHTLALDGTISKDELGHIYHLSNLEHLKLFGLGMNLLNILPEIEMDNEECIGLNMVKLFIIRLPKLQTLMFRECSTSSLDWNRIADWLRGDAPNYGIVVELFFYDFQGRRTMHGFSLQLPENIRTNIAIDIGDDEIISEGYTTILQETAADLVSLLD